jgi:tetratricopeptide (TPR) repeat protein
VGSYQKALEINPESASCHFNLGTAYTDLYDVEKAVEHYRLCIKYDAANIEASILLAKLLAKYKDNKEALQVLQKAKEYTSNVKELQSIETTIQ